eukprot:1382049-Amorphochlora_amoeboformis.AAC.1
MAPHIESPGTRFYVALSVRVASTALCQRGVHTPRPFLRTVSPQVAEALLYVWTPPPPSLSSARNAIRSKTRLTCVHQPRRTVNMQAILRQLSKHKLVPFVQFFVRIYSISLLSMWHQDSKIDSNQELKPSTDIANTHNTTCFACGNQFSVYSQ